MDEQQNYQTPTSNPNKKRGRPRKENLCNNIPGASENSGIVHAPFKILKLQYAHFKVWCLYIVVQVYTEYFKHSALQTPASLLIKKRGRPIKNSFDMHKIQQHSTSFNLSDTPGQSFTIFTQIICYDFFLCLHVHVSVCHLYLIIYTLLWLGSTRSNRVINSQLTPMPILTGLFYLFIIKYLNFLIDCSFRLL